MSEFRTELGKNWFNSKYALFPGETWSQRCRAVVEAVCGGILSQDEVDYGIEMMRQFKWLPGGRYIYYGGRKVKYWNNCFILIGQEDTREEWARLMGDSASCLLTGGGIGVDYSIFRERGRELNRTGGTASGPIPLMQAVNDFGRRARQGGGRRSAIYASLDWQHGDVDEFLHVKDWKNQQLWPGGPSYWQAKMENFDADAPLDMTNISLNYDDVWVNDPSRALNQTFLKNIEMAMRNGEPGFSFNFGKYAGETGRNAPVAGDTRVITSTGYQFVENIVNMPVTVWTGKQWASTVFRRTNTDVDTITVHLSNGRSVTCDPTHPFVTWTKQGEKRIPAKNLGSGDSLVCDLPLNGKPDRPGGDYGWGFVWGDGHVRDGKGDIQVFADTKLDCFAKACNELGAYGGPTRKYFKTVYKQKPFLLSPSFVAGWFDADGNSTRNLLRLASSDEEALYKLQEYLDTLGIKSVVRRDGKCNYGTNNSMYTLGVWKDSHNRFIECIPTIRVRPSWVRSVRKQNIKVVDVEPSWRTEDVYCCDVGVEEHSFMAEGVIVSNCTEVSTSDDSDVCNLASVNLARVETIEELKEVQDFVGRFCVCGSIRADVPYERVAITRDKNRRLGQGLMGFHEWLLKRGYKYEYNHELSLWLDAWEEASVHGAYTLCQELGISHPVAYRAIAPNGTIGGLAGTIGGIEPIFAVAYKRRWLDGETRKYQYFVDHAAKILIGDGISPDDIESSIDLADDVERRLSMQYHIQQHVDMSISSTINLPAWGTELNNRDRIEPMARLVSEYAPGLRGLTFYPDGARGGQPLQQVDYDWAMKHGDEVYEEQNDACRDGLCGI